MLRKILGFIIFIIFFFSFSYYFFYFFKNPLKEPKGIEINEGERAKKLLKNLEREKIIPFWQPYYIFLKFSKKDKKLMAGEYLIEPRETFKETLDKFLKGKIVQISLTFKEGWTSYDYAKELEKNKICKFEDFLEEIKKIPKGLKTSSLEGFLFPDTYFFSKNMKPEEVIRRLYKNFLFKTKDLRQKLEESPFSKIEWVTLASIVEKEAKLEDEKPKIAGVYLNRLKKNMKLEADPTVIYGILKAGFDIKVLLKKDLLFPSPYNTYLNYGLPPGPICNPSYTSLKAVLYPEKHNFYFFVAKGDGSHQFSEKFEEHLKNIQKYR